MRDYFEDSAHRVAGAERLVHQLLHLPLNFSVNAAEHNILFPAQLGRWFSRLTFGPTILVGEEVTTRRFHVHGLRRRTMTERKEV